MRKMIVLLMLLLVSLGMFSCSVNDRNLSNDSISDSVLTKEQLIARNLDLQSQIDSLKLELEKIKGDAEIKANLDDMRADYTKKIEEKYPEVKIINQNGESLQKVVVYREDEPEEFQIVEEQIIISSIKNSFKVIYAYTNESVFSSGIELYEYEMHYGNDKVIIRISDNNTFTMSKYPGIYFVTSQRIDFLGNALLKSRKNYPNESVLSKLLNSGIMINNTQQYAYDEWRRNYIVDIFIRTTKSEVEMPSLSDSDIRVRLEFLYRDDILLMTVYKEHILINDAKENICYKIKNEDIESLLSALSAG